MGISGSGSDFAGSMGPVSSSLFVTSNTGLVGQPSIASQSLGVVGPTVPAGSTAIASNGNSLEGGILYGPTLDWNAWLEDEPQLARLKKEAELAPVDGHYMLRHPQPSRLAKRRWLRAREPMRERSKRPSGSCNWALGFKTGWAWRRGPARPSLLHRRRSRRARLRKI